MVVSEVLLALQGLSGDYLVVGGEKGENGLWGAVADRFHPSERQLLKRLCIVGAAYRTVSDFVEQTASGASLQGGMYMRALGGGLARQLQGYRAVLVRLEKELRAGEFPPMLTYLTNAVDEEEPLLRRLQLLVNAIHERHLTGMALIDEVLVLANHGVQRIRQAGADLLLCLLRVLFKQLSCWVAHGQLVDPANEFFIVQSAVRAAAAPVAAVDTQSLDDTLTTVERHEEDAAAAQRTATQFDIVRARVPSILTLEQAESIRFIGRAMRIVLGNRKGTFGAAEQRAMADSFDACLERFAARPLLDPRFPPLPFDPLQFADLLSSCRAVVAKELYDQLVTHSHLHEHFDNIRALLLLGHGDMAASLIDESAKVQLQAPSKLQPDVIALFRRAVAAAQAENEPFVAHARLELRPSVGGAADPLRFPFRVTYRVDFPANLVLSESVLERYHNVFLLLLLVRRAHMAALSAWHPMFHPALRGRAAQLRSLWACRHVMTTFVASIQSYLQMDAVSMLDSQFRKDVADCADFDQVVRLHSAHLAAIETQCFVADAALLEPLSSVLSLIILYCGQLQRYYNGASLQSEGALQQTFQRFVEAARHFAAAVADARSAAHNSHLEQLLLRLSPNGDFWTPSPAHSQE